MSDAGSTVVVPPRPLTVGEVLDSAVLLLRDHAAVLVPPALLLAAGEQLLLHPLRRAAGVGPPSWFGFSEIVPFWLLLAVGAATEAVIILLLGNPAARAAGAALLGHPAGSRELLRPARARWGATALTVAPIAVLMFAAALLGPFWLLGFALLGGVAPALVVDRVTGLRAVPRSASLAVRGGRVALLRLLGYLIWWVLRVGLGVGIFFGVRRLDLLDADAAGALSLVVWAAVNAVAYPALACLDAVLHLEARIRTEGLDLRLSRARARAQDAEDALLAVGR